MATRILDVLVGIIPLALLFPILTNLFGGLIGGQVAYVFDVVSRGAPKTSVTAVNRQYTGIPSMTNYIKMYYLRLSNPGNTDIQVKVRIGETSDVATPLTKDNDVTKLILPAGGMASYQLIFYEFANLGAPDAATLNGKFLRFEFDVTVTVEIAGVMFLSLPPVQATISKAG